MSRGYIVFCRNLCLYFSSKEELEIWCQGQKREYVAHDLDRASDGQILLAATNPLL